MRKSIILTAFAVFCLVTVAANATNFLEEEAGICAYTNAGKTIDFARVKPIYRTIEYEMSNYIIGSVPIADYAETEDVHVFVSKDGWVAAYYPAGDPVSKIIDWRNYQGNEITSTKLELALKKVADTVNFPLVNVKYYDFVCPQATNLMMVIDSEVGSKPDSFDIMVPSEIIVYERSWGQFLSVMEGGAGVILHIDDNEISNLTTGRWSWGIRYGKLTPDQLKQGMFHAVKIQGSSNQVSSCAGGIVLIYQKL